MGPKGSSLCLPEVMVPWSGQCQAQSEPRPRSGPSLSWVPWDTWGTLTQLCTPSGLTSPATGQQVWAAWFLGGPGFMGEKTRTVLEKSRRCMGQLA